MAYVQAAASTSHMELMCSPRVMAIPPRHSAATAATATQKRYPKTFIGLSLLHGRTCFASGQGAARSLTVAVQCRALRKGGSVLLAGESACPTYFRFRRANESPW